MICVKRNECINVFFQKKQTCFLVNCLTLYKFNFELQKQEIIADDLPERLSGNGGDELFAMSYAFGVLKRYEIVGFIFGSLIL